MVRNDLFVTVPSFFKCPISLDVMKSPVSLCTGVTYDRSSIQAWLDNGNNTCPATMQVLPSKDFVPNHNLYRLIQIWSDSESPAKVSRVGVKDLIVTIKSKDCSTESVMRILEFAKESDLNRKFLAEYEGFVASLAEVLSNVKNRESKETINLIGEVIRVLDLVLVEFRDKDGGFRRSMTKNREFLASVVLILQKGSLDSRIASVRVLESISTDADSKLQVAETKGVLNELFRLINTENNSNSTNPAAIEAGLSCLLKISTSRRIKTKIVCLGYVQQLAKTLSQLESKPISIIEKLLKLLEMISTCTEGRTAISSDPICVTSVVEKMLKVSKAVNDHAVVIVWSVCYLFRDETAQAAVVKNNGLTKILLIMQSNCSPSVRQMCGDLMKIFRVNSKSCLSSYDTKTTHIMPF